MGEKKGLTGSRPKRVKRKRSPGRRWVVQAKGDWAGQTGGWRPAIDGTINQTGRSAEEASTFTNRGEAFRALDLCLRENIDGTAKFRVWCLVGNQEEAAHG